MKLGGSAITDKSRACTPNLSLIQSVAGRVSRHLGPLVLLHGGGSYAHPVVTKAKLQEGYKGSFQLISVSKTELYLDQLTRIIGVSLVLRGRAFVPIRPMSFIMMNRGQIAGSFLEPIKSALRLGLIPLIHGDLAFDRTKGYGVVSADRLASYLGLSLGASRVLFGCDVDGVYTENPKVSSKAQLVTEINKKNANSVLRRLTTHRSSDATGGMLGKVKEALRIARNGRESCIFNLKSDETLRDALRGGIFKGTRFVPWDRRS